MSGAAKALVALGGLFALAALAWMAFLPALVERELRAVTGFDVRVEVLTANPFTGSVVVEGLSARNPAGYPAPDFIELRGLRADIDEFSWLLTDRIVLNTLDLDAEKVELVLERDGTSNAGAFAAACSRGRPGPAAPGPAPARPARYLIRKLHVRLDRLVVADYSRPNSDEKAYDLHLDETFINVSDPKQLLVPEFIRSLHAFGLHRDVSQLLPGDFGKALADAVGGAAQAGSRLKDATRQATDYLRGALDKLEQSAKP